MSNSMKNLKEAFAGESQANRSYLAFAAKAEEEGYPLVAKRFRVAAASETVYAINHLKVMGGVKSTAENLGSSMSGENFEKMSRKPRSALMRPTRQRNSTKPCLRKLWTIRTTFRTRPTLFVRSVGCPMRTNLRRSAWYAGRPGARSRKSSRDIRSQEEREYATE